VFLLATLFQSVLFAGLAALVIFGTAGRVDLWNVWAYLGIFLGLFVFQTLAIHFKNPGLLKERIKPAVSGRFRLMMAIGAFGGFTLHWGVAGLDQRFHWTDRIPQAGIIAALAVFAIGLLLLIWPMLVNPFFSTAVRIQEDRGQQVISSGPYAIVRHPGYAGGLVAMVASAVALNSLLALIPVVLFIAAIAYRTADEDRMLQKDLAGYADYSRKVRYRLVPGVW
jgi:protein-S-isoprenylcysteine O-methyltransferase Ste14